jgi:hypothetical protein
VRHGNPDRHTSCNLRCVPKENVHAEVLYAKPDVERPAPGAIGTMLPFGRVLLISVEDAPEAPDASFEGGGDLTQKTLFVYKILGED